MHKLYMLEEKLCKELEEVSGKELTRSNLEVIDLLAHAMKSLATYVAMKESSGGSYNGGSVYDNRSFRGGSYNGGSYENGSYDRGSYNGTGSYERDSVGRYSNEQYSRGYDGYSRGEHDQFKQQLHELMQQAPSGTIRQELQKIASQAGQM